MPGIWTTQNKVIPGVYIRFGSTQQQTLTAGSRGTVAICEMLKWGNPSTVVEINAGDDTTPYCGYDITSPDATFLREMFKGTNRTPGASKVLLYRPATAGSAKATVTVGNLTATAKYVGTRGNDISIVIVADVDTETFTVDTIVDSVIVDQQYNIATVANLVNNDWVDWSGTGAVSATTGAALTGGADGTLATSTFATFLTAIEAYKFDVLVLDLEDSSVQAAYINFVKRMNEENGVACQLVASNLTSPDTRYAINCVSGATLEDNTVLEARQVTWWLAGAMAGATYFQSLTNATYPGAVSTTNLTRSALTAALNAGKLVLQSDNGRVSIVQDIDSLVTYTTDISEIYRYNKTMRLCSSIANDLYNEFSENYIGVVNNNAQGRAMFKAAIVGYLMDVEGNEGIQDFSPDDVTVEQGDAINAVVVTISVKPVGAVEKIYVTIEMDV